jgi:hypothetical protein
MQVSQRLARRVRREFPDDLSSDILTSLERFDEAYLDGQDPERVGTAIVILAARGVALDAVIGLAERDWRDLLVAAELGNEDWRQGLAAYLDPGGPATPHQ